MTSEDDAVPEGDQSELDDGNGALELEPEGQLLQSDHPAPLCSAEMEDTSWSKHDGGSMLLKGQTV